MVVLSYIQLWIANLGDNYLDVGALMFTYESSVILEKILWVINEVFWVILVYTHEDWVHCRWWEVMVKIWLIFFWLLFSNCVFNRIIKYLFFFILLYDVLFICIENICGFFVIVHSVDVVMWVKKVDLINVWFMYYKGCFGGTWFLCVNIIVEVFGSWYMFVIILNELFSCCLFFKNNILLKGNVSNFSSCCINTSLTSLLSRIHPIHFSFGYGGDNFFDIWKYLGWYCWHVCLYTYWNWLGTFWWWNIFQNFLLTTVLIMVREMLFSYHHILIIAFKRILPFWMEIYCWVNVSVDCVKILHTLIKKKSCIVVGDFVLKFTRCIQLWCCLFVLFHH